MKRQNLVDNPAGVKLTEGSFLFLRVCILSCLFFGLLDRFDRFRWSNGRRRRHFADRDGDLNVFVVIFRRSLSIL